MSQERKCPAVTRFHQNRWLNWSEVAFLTISSTWFALTWLTESAATHSGSSPYVRRLACLPRANFKNLNSVSQEIGSSTTSKHKSALIATPTSWKLKTIKTTRWCVQCVLKSQVTSPFVGSACKNGRLLGTISAATLNVAFRALILC